MISLSFLLCENEYGVNVNVTPFMISLLLILFEVHPIKSNHTRGQDHGDQIQIFSIFIFVQIVYVSVCKIKI
ncbi:unnamed protein product [Meloidogyne enterolobii]|uniref:Uncharacterized protein n=1 Tax=Meloidogyne enterolobii TaxID=390850 RepID=A0ACB1ATA4_MELEN